MNKKCLVSVISAFVFIVAFDMVVHGQLMAGMYQETASVWRPQSECNMTFMMLSQFLFAILAAASFKQVNMKGQEFGVMVGGLIGVVQLSSYMWLPIPLSLALTWLAVWLLKGIGLGLVLEKTSSCNN